MSAAHTEEASITAFILPDWARTSYYKYMADPRVQRVARIFKQHFRFKTPDFWKTGRDSAGNPKWNINPLVANAAGLSKYDPNTLQQTLQQALPGFLVPNLPSRSSMLQQLDLSSEQTHLSEGFKKILSNSADHLQPCISATEPSTCPLEAPQQSAFPAASGIVFTDGSAGDGPQGHCIGAGVYCRDHNINLKVDPCGRSATNTITRAELVAILAAVQQMETQDCTIATDSLASMFMINNALRSFGRTSESPHSELLKVIAQVILSRAKLGLETSLLKVKSHIGVQGNEMADQLANAARDSEQCSISIAIGSDAFNDREWPAILKRSGNSQGQQQQTWHKAGNLHACIRKHVAAKGLTRSGEYHGYWANVTTELHASSFGFWRNPAIPFWTKVNLLKPRWGQLWNKSIACSRKVAYMSGQARATNPSCPLCGEKDGISHMLGGCTHPLITALQTKRHNLASRKIPGLLQEGALGNCYTIADVGSHARLGNLGALDSRIPTWLVSDIEASEHGVDRQKLRPDIMITNFPHDQVSQPTCSQRLQVWILEVGYSAATRYYEKLAEKQQQNQCLQRILEAKGVIVHILPVLLGNTGEIFNSTLHNIKQAGADHDRVDRLASQLSTHAQHAMQTIIKCRRVAENDSTARTSRRYDPRG